MDSRRRYRVVVASLIDSVVLPTRSTSITMTTNSSPISASSPVLVTPPNHDANLSIPQVPPAEAEPVRVSAEVEEQPTDSHVLANVTPEEKGIAQFEHDSPEVRDLGWQQREILEDDVAPRIVGGLNNADLWLLIRRFNKVGTLVEKRLIMIYSMLAG